MLRRAYSVAGISPVEPNLFALSTLGASGLEEKFSFQSLAITEKNISAALHIMEQSSKNYFAAKRGQTKQHV